MKFTISVIANVLLIAALAYFYLRADHADDQRAALLQLLENQKKVQAELLKHQDENRDLSQQLAVLESEKDSLTKQKTVLQKTVTDYQALATVTKTMAAAERVPRAQLLQNLMTLEEELVTLKREHQNTVSTVKMLTDQLGTLKHARTTLEARKLVKGLNEELLNEQNKATLAANELMRATLGKNDLRRDVVSLEYEETSIKRLLENATPPPATAGSSAEVEKASP